MKEDYFFSIESVSNGHPDKLADQISDAILDAYLEEDPDAKVACDALVADNRIIVAGEITSTAKLHSKIKSIIRELLIDIGYDHHSQELDPETIKITNLISEQSPDIHETSLKGGAISQCTLFGYACNESEHLMPLPVSLANTLMEQFFHLCKTGSYPWLMPHAETQLIVEYKDAKLAVIDTIILSAQHWPYVLSAHSQGSGMGPHGHYSNAMVITEKILRETLIENVIKKAIPPPLLPDNTKIIINSLNIFKKANFTSKSGLSGRKNTVDTYGGYCPHGGSSFSGKDPSKVDRSGAYMARYIAKNIVASGIAEKCMVQIAYSIGRAQPISFLLDFLGTGIVNERMVETFIKENIDLTPNGIIDRFQLKRPIFLKTASFGHFGRPALQWEKVDIAKDIKEQYASK